MDGPLGPMLLAGDDTALTGLWFDGQAYLPPLAPAAGPPPASVAAARAQLDAYFAGARRAFDLELAPGGTPFQRRVWAALATIRHGETLSYAGLAARAGLSPRHVRAAAAANARNPISIVIPCHRVIAAGGALTGYAGGLERKAALLALEAGAAPQGSRMA